MLGFFSAQVEFQENVDDLVVGDSPGGDGLQQMQGIYGLHQGNIGQYQLELIGLQMADEMPLHVCGHLRDLGGKLLRSAFRKHPLPGVIRLHQAFHGMKFGNCHQGNI